MTKRGIVVMVVLTALSALGALRAGQVVGVQRVGILDYTGLTSAPSNPPTNLGRVYYNSTTKALSCLNSDGTACLPPASGGSPGGSFGDIQFNCSGVFGNANCVHAGDQANDAAGVITLASGVSVNLTGTGSGTVTLDSAGDANIFLTPTSVQLALGVAGTIELNATGGATIQLISPNLNATGANGELDLGAASVGFGGVLGLKGSTSGKCTDTVDATATTITSNCALVATNATATSELASGAGSLNLVAVGATAVLVEAGQGTSSLIETAANQITLTAGTGAIALSSTSGGASLSGVGVTLNASTNPITLVSTNLNTTAGELDLGGVSLGGVLGLEGSTSGACKFTVNATGTSLASSCPITGLGFANTALSNLATVAINTALLPGTTNSIALGASNDLWSNVFTTALNCGLGGTTSCVITGNGATSGSWTITGPAVAGTATNPVVSSNSLQITAAGTSSAPALVFASGFGLFNPAGNEINLAGGGINKELFNRDFDGQVKTVAAGAYVFSSTSDAQGSSDTGISRGAAGVVDVGNGSAADVSGTVAAAHFTGGGNAGVTAGSFSAVTSIASTGGIVTTLTGTSDALLKTDIHPFLRGVKDLEKLETDCYGWNAEGRKITGFPADLRQCGYTAEALQAAIPEAVPTQREMHDGIGYLTVNDRPVIAALVNAVKEQQQEIEQLKKEIAKLKAH